MKTIDIKKINNHQLGEYLISLRDSQIINPDLTFKKNARIRILNKIQDLKGSARPMPVRFSLFSLLRSFRYGIAAIAVLLIGGVGTVFAAQSSLPDNPLYPVKIISEKLIYAIAPTPQLKEEIGKAINQRRDEENKILQRDKKPQIIIETENVKENENQDKKKLNSLEDNHKVEKEEKREQSHESKKNGQDHPGNIDSKKVNNNK